MNWLTWHHLQSGNRTVVAHAAEDMRANRTLCGALISVLSAPAPRSIPRCQKCERTVKLNAAERRKQRLY